MDEKVKPHAFEEFEFFDKVKKLLNSKFVYAEFLKCLNLFSQVNFSFSFCQIK